MSKRGNEGLGGTKREELGARRACVARGARKGLEGLTFNLATKCSKLVLGLRVRTGRISVLFLPASEALRVYFLLCWCCCSC
jgi:hypothetical protein